MTASFSLLDGEASQPTPQRIAQTREFVVSEGIRRIFLEPQTNVSLVETIFDGVEVTHCEVDPIGADIAAGAKQYWENVKKSKLFIKGLFLKLCATTFELFYLKTVP